MALPPDDRRCTAQGKDGERCKAWMSTKVLEERGERLCSGHGGLGLAASSDAATAAAKQSGANRQEQAVARKKRPVDVYRDAMVRLAEVFVKERERIISDPQASDADKLKAMEQLENRAMGRSTEHVDLTVNEPTTVDELRRMSPEDRRQLLRQLQADGRMPTLRAVGDD